MAMGRPRSFCMDTALDEAMEVFWRHGYDGATLAMLTKAMGIKAPSLYAAFGSKEGLLKAALDRYAERRSAHMGYVLAGATAREVAERFLSSIAESHTDPANPPGCLLVQGGLACGAGSENIPFELAARRAQTETELRERFVRAQADGDLPEGSDPAALARFLSTVASGMGVLASSGADREALREVARVSLGAFAGCREAVGASMEAGVPRRLLPGSRPPHG
ncbi:TetR/AcrR family transcriptional regulator [Methylobacterium nonmethylotrophicum]|uniref:TetR/AcrR family transcriptional regulator n=1 Tax=Methylobacterium nonmethylotrophicum TaxID=1141884 RepID=A0A4Z0NV39_9HYPH|nr:TetR/AcrR family transcriptional regulator [Methylobacterium nonmethylotrophicum]TGE00236.1 TetR/AcrR family transcriptional regulator [Methylobacterium nonmethylotrophicum]